MDKDNLRKIYSSKQAIDESINRAIVSSSADFIEKYHDAKLIGLYLPLVGEIDLTGLMAQFSHRKFAVPKIKDQHIYFTHYQPGDGLKKNESFPSYCEPVSEIEVVPDLIFVPAIAFDIKGNRLGRGKGHYDRYLAKHNIIRIGVTTGTKLLMSLPNEPHDFKMNYVITEDIILDLCH